MLSQLKAKISDLQELSQKKIQPCLGDITTGLCSPRALNDNKPFDAAIASMALHHVQDVPAVLRALASQLRSGGVLSLVDLEKVPEPDGTTTGDVFFTADTRHLITHLGFSRVEMEELLKQAGMVNEISFKTILTFQQRIPDDAGHTHEHQYNHDGHGEHVAAATDQSHPHHEPAAAPVHQHPQENDHGATAHHHGSDQGGVAAHQHEVNAGELHTFSLFLATATKP